MENKNDLYHCCRWCKWFDKGKCINPDIFGEADEINLYPFWEEGHLSEAIKEGFTEFKASEMYKALLETKLSKKKIHELMVLLASDIESAFANWTESIDENVSTALTNYSSGLDAEGVEIRNSEEFYCKYFW